MLPRQLYRESTCRSEMQELSRPLALTLPCRDDPRLPGRIDHADRQSDDDRRDDPITLCQRNATLVNVAARH